MYPLFPQNTEYNQEWGVRGIKKLKWLWLPVCCWTKLSLGKIKLEVEGKGEMGEMHGSYLRKKDMGVERKILAQSKV